MIDVSRAARRRDDGLHLRRLAVGVLALGGVLVIFYINRPEEVARRAIEADAERQQSIALVAHCVEVARVYDKDFDAYRDGAGRIMKLEDSTAHFQFEKCVAEPPVVDQVPAGYQRRCDDDLCSRWHLEAAQ
jgi:hypothetical protein